MKWTEGGIARAVALQTLARKCVVLVDRCNWTGYECDVLGVTTDLRIIDVEVKISRQDLKADAKKDKWWHRTFLGYGERKEIHNEAGRLIRVERPSLYDSKPLEHPRKVWKHYYCLPQEIWKPELLECLPSPASGVILMREQRNSATPVVAKVVLPDGTVKIEIGEEVLTLTPREDRALALVQSGAATQAIAIESSRQQSLVMAEMAAKLQRIEREYAALKAQREDARQVGMFAT